MKRTLPSLALLALLVTGCARPPGSAPSERQTTPFAARPHPIPGVVEAENFDEGEPGAAYFDSDTVNHGVAYRGRTQVDIEGRKDASNGHGIGWIQAGEWLVYTVDVRESGTYEVEMPVAASKLGGLIHIEVDGKDVTGPIRLPNTGSWMNLRRIRVGSVRLTRGIRTLRLVMDENGEDGTVGDIDFMRFERVR